MTEDNCSYCKKPMDHDEQGVCMAVWYGSFKLACRKCVRKWLDYKEI